MSELRLPAINQYVVSGRLTADPTSGPAGNAKNLAKFSIAQSKKWKDKSGNEKEEVMFLNCVAWDKTADFAMNLKKGAAVILQGRLRQNTWEDASGQKRSQIEMTVENVQPLEWASDGERKTTPIASNRPTANTPSTGRIGDGQDDIPF